MKAAISILLVFALLTVVMSIFFSLQGNILMGGVLMIVSIISLIAARVVGFAAGIDIFRDDV